MIVRDIATLICFYCSPTGEKKHGVAIKSVQSILGLKSLQICSGAVSAGIKLLLLQTLQQVQNSMHREWLPLPSYHPGKRNKYDKHTLILL